jgi:hypothetical protein
MCHTEYRLNTFFMQLQFHESNTQMHIRSKSISLKCIFVAHCLVLYVHTYMVQKCNIWQNTLPWHEAVNNGGPDLMNHVMWKEERVLFTGKTVPLPYFTQQIKYCRVLILWFVYMPFGLQFVVCCLLYLYHLMTALNESQIKTVAQ